jgi:hypothetical protein
VTTPSSHTPAHAAGPSDANVVPPAPSPALIGAAVVGLALLAGGIATDATRGFTALLSAGFVAVTASLGALAILALCQVANAGFHVTAKRVLEALAVTLPVGAVAMLALLPFTSHVWAWARPGADADPIIHAKVAYLNFPFFAARMVLFLGVWTAFAFVLRAESRAQDADGDVRHTKRGVLFSALFILFGGYSIGLASVDWLMSCDPRWASTIYGFYTIGGILQTGAAVALLALISLRRAGKLPEVTPHHLHDFGKLLFAFSTLWAYLWFSQYLLIWYANLPEEAAWVVTRTTGTWAPLYFGGVVINWVLPFLLLLPKPAKRAPDHLFRMASLVVFGRFLDAWLQAAPATMKGPPALPWIELGAFVGVGAVFWLVYGRMLAGAPMVAKHDPYLVEALHHRT